MTAPAGEYPALGFDPAPGELERVAEVADKYKTVSTKLTSAKTALESIINQTGTWEGEASEAFARRVGDLPEYLGKATESMAKASGALGQWSGSLATMQAHARELEARAQDARKQAELARNNPAFDLANQTFHDQESLRAAQRALDAAARQLTEAIDGLEAIIKAAERLLAQHTELAERIAELLKQAREIAPDEPGWLSKALSDIADWATETINDAIDVVTDVVQAIGDFIEDHANLIAKVSDIVGDLSTVIGVVADFLPPPADTVVGAVSLGLGVVALGGHLTAMAAGAEGVTAETIMLDSVGVATGLVGLIPLVPGGVANAAFQAGYEGAARLDGQEGNTTVGKFIPRDERQWITAAGGILFPPLLLAPGLENMGTSWVEGVQEGHAADQAGQAERDRERAEERVWQD
ncbi:putative T7SS-secreted protein [Amycolatopsis lurida]